MVHSMTWPIVGALAVTGVGAGVHLGHSAIAEINPIYYNEPATRFHADLSASRPSDSPTPMRLSAPDPAELGTACVGCRTYPEEYYPIHDASIDRYATAYAERSATAEPTPVAETADPELERLRADMMRVENYARGAEAGPAEVELASAEAQTQGEVALPVE